MQNRWSVVAKMLRLLEDLALANVPARHSLKIIPAKNPNRGGEDVNANHFLEVFRKWSLFVEVGVQCKCIVYMYSVSVWCECIV